MNTQQAIQTLQGILNTVQLNSTGYKAQADAIQVAIDQLNGILGTPSADLIQANQTILALQAQIVLLQNQINVLTVPASLPIIT